MKILIVTPRFYPESFSIWPIAKKLSEMGNEITVLTGRPHYGYGKLFDGYEKIYEQDVDGVHIIRVKEHIRKKSTLSLILNYLSVYFKFNSKLKHLEFDFDVVLSHTLSPIFAIRGVPSFCKKHKIPHMHYGLDIWPESFVASGYIKNKNGFFYKKIKAIAKSIYKSCDLISFASPCVESYLKDELNVTVPFKHIYQPCLNKQPEFKDIMFNSFGNKKHILFCGTIAKFNHLDLIINAFKNPKISSSFVLDIVGSGSDMQRCMQLVVENSLDSSIIFHGRVPSAETKSYYCNTDFLFVPLFYNSYTSNMIPQKVIEYFMYGKPILGMLKGDGADLINKASKLNVLCDQTTEDLEKSLLSLDTLSFDQIKQCGIENYNFFANSSRFQLETVSEEIQNSLKELVEHNAKKN